MIYLFYGDHTMEARKKAHALIDALRKKRPDAELFAFDIEKLHPAELEALIVSQGLFDEKHIVFLDGVLKHKQTEAFVIEHLPQLKESPHVFVVLEEKLAKPILSKLEKYAEKVQEYPLAAGGKKSGLGNGRMMGRNEFNIFSLTDALGSRDKKELWVLYAETLERDISAEEVHGILLWQVKNMLIASEEKATAESAGLSPFVFRKSHAYAKNFTSEELVALSARLVSLYHDARRGVEELGVALERFVLDL